MNPQCLPPLARRSLLAIAAALPLLVHAQAWPSRPVRIIVPSSPASPPDAVIRAMEDVLAKQLGQPLVVENKAGAQGAIGLEQLARSEPDGYTFGLINTQSVSATALRKDMPYKLETSFAPVAQLTFEAPVLIVSTKLQVGNLQDLVRLLRAKGDRMTYASSGSGTPSHLGMELFKREIGSQVLHIPYRGAAAASVDVAGGQADLTLVGSNVASQLIKGGRVKALAVSSDRRLPALPQVPTFAEAGWRNIDLRGWVGLVAPAGTSAAIMERMQQAVQATLSTPAVRQRFAMLGSTPTASNPGEFAAFIAQEDMRWKKVVKDANIQFD